MNAEPAAPSRDVSLDASGVLTAVSLMRNLERDFLGTVRGWFDAYGDVVLVKSPAETIGLVRHPDHIHQMLVAQADVWVKDGTYTNPKRGLRKFLGNGLLNSDGAFWKRQRKLTAPALHHKRIIGYFDMMVHSTRTLVESWRGLTTVDVDEAMMHTTLDIVTRSLFNTALEEDARRIGSAMDVIQGFVGRQNSPAALLPDWVNLPALIRERGANDDMDEIVYRVIGERRAQGGQDTGDLLSMLLAARDDDGAPMSDVQIRDEIVTMFLAGHETTANTLNWLWVLLAQHPQVEQALHEEIDRVLDGGRRTPTLDDLKAMPYSAQVVKEAMRLYPVAFTFSRMPVEDTVLGDVLIEKGTPVNVISYWTHRDPRWWPNPDAFDPTRFAPENEASHQRYAYLPFGGGPRICIGNGFAMMEAQLMLVMIASRFRLRLTGPAPEIDPLLTLRPKGGLTMALEARG
jgi:cytochrome P450